METQTLVNAILPVIVAIFFAFLAGGATVAALLLLALNMILKSPVILSTLEKLYAGLAPEWQDVLKSAVQVGEDITDGVSSGTAPAA